MKKITPIIFIIVGMIVGLIGYKIFKNENKDDISFIQSISFDGEVTFKLMDVNGDIEEINYLDDNDGTQSIIVKDKNIFLEKYIYNHKNFYKKIIKDEIEYIVLNYDGYYFTIFNLSSNTKNVLFSHCYAASKGVKHEDLAFEYFSQEQHLELGEENEYFDIINSYEDAKDFYKESVNAKFDDENKEIFLKASNLSLRTTQDNVEKLEGYPVKISFYEDYFIVTEI